jgi:hypothetical protein
VRDETRITVTAANDGTEVVLVEAAA